MAVTDYAKLCREHNERILKEKIVRFGPPSSPNFINRVGEIYGKLKVIDVVGSDANHAVYYMCECSCKDKNRKIIKYSALCSGNTSSCGCGHQEKMREILTTHGMSGHGGKNRHRLYIIYNGMKTRCTNPRQKYWDRYGGRGISICDEWNDIENGFINFYNWAINNGYEKGLSLDRINPDGNYEPNNCRWADDFTQGNNNSGNTYMTCGFFTFTISIWCKITGLTNSNVMYRKQCGWTDEEIICTPRYMQRGEKYRVLSIPEEFKKFNKYSEFHK